MDYEFTCPTLSPLPGIDEFISTARRFGQIAAEIVVIPNRSNSSCRSFALRKFKTLENRTKYLQLMIITSGSESFDCIRFRVSEFDTLRKDTPTLVNRSAPRKPLSTIHQFFHEFDVEENQFGLPV